MLDGIGGVTFVPGNHLWPHKSMAKGQGKGASLVYWERLFVRHKMQRWTLHSYGLKIYGWCMPLSRRIRSFEIQNRASNTQMIDQIFGTTRALQYQNHQIMRCNIALGHHIIMLLCFKEVHQSSYVGGLLTSYKLWRGLSVTQST
jgi:hypothetical protein